MKSNLSHIETAVVSRSPGEAYGRLYSMHKYWSKKSSDVVAAYIKKYTNVGDIVLEPFCGSGVVACEAVRLNRRAIAIDINPMATFITRVTLTPVNLSRLQWAFRDLTTVCEDVVNRLFVTKCVNCGKDAVVEFVVRDGDVPIRIAYSCTCLHQRLFKEPNRSDRRLDNSFKKKRIPYWYPRGVRLPIIQRERFQYLHELFTKRNLIALSIILNAIEKIEDLKIQEVMKLTFTASLDKCSRLKPLSGPKTNPCPSLSEGWIAVRFYTPKLWQEVNPWHAFVRSFSRIYEGKKESNDKLKTANVGSIYDDLHTKSANVIIFNGSADTILNKKLPRRSVDYVLTDPPFGAHIQYLSLSTFWGTWLKFNFDYDKELVVNRYRSKTLEDYNFHLGQILKSIRRVVKPNRYVHIFFHDVRGPYLHNMLKLMAKSKIVPERVLHQPSPNSFGAAVRNIKKGGGKGHYGSYIVRGRVIDRAISIKKDSATRVLLRKKVAKASKFALEIREGSVSVGTLLHSIYQSLNGDEILMFAQYPVAKFLQDATSEFAIIKKDEVRLINSRKKNKHDIIEEIRTALLDANSLYISNSKKRGNIYQIRQHVLSRFQNEGITIDDIYHKEKDISSLEIRKHRKHRLLKLFRLLGKILNYKCSTTQKSDGIVWEVSCDVRISFKVTDEAILVKAVRTIQDTDIASEVGTIADVKFEKALLKWCQNNPTKKNEIRKHLNPMEEATFSNTRISPKHLRLKVLENKELCPDHYLITFQIAESQMREPPRPGQFFHVICDPDGGKTLTDSRKKRGYALTLRRPFSVHRIKYVNFDRRLLNTPTIIPYEIKDVIDRPISQIDILYKVVGQGTKNLSQVHPGRYLDVIGPIGNGFKIDKVDKAVIVAGGIGVAPLMALAERLRYLGSKIFLYFGALRLELLTPILSRSDSQELQKLLPTLSRSDSAVELGYANGTPAFRELINKEFKDIGTEWVRVCTEDAYLGESALVTDILERDIESGILPYSNITIYACGPPKMMEAVSTLARRYRISCQVLLEERMACGIGACFSCTCHVRDKNGNVERKRVCVDGPVFKSEEIQWRV